VLYGRIRRSPGGELLERIARRGPILTEEELAAAEEAKHSGKVPEGKWARG